MTPYSMSLLAVFLASLTGSLHCAGMCGGFVSLYSSMAKNCARAHLLYHLGRLVCYCLLGVLAGLVGENLNQLSAMIGLQQITTVFLGVSLVITGLIILRPALIGPRFSAIVAKLGLRSGVWQSTAQFFMGRLLKLKDSLPRDSFALLLGLGSALLPCGWLYLYVVAAGSTSSPFMGAALMAVFWAGTLPALLFVGQFSRFGSSLLGRYTPTLVGIILVLAGIFSLSSHSHNVFAAPELQTQGHCHSS